MPETKRGSAPLADSLRRAIRDSGLSFNDLGWRAGVNQAQISRFMLGQRDVTVQVASRLCLVLGYELVRTGELLTEQLAEPPPSTRRRPANSPGPKSAYRRGQGRRVDLESREAAGVEDTEPATPMPGRPRGRRPAAASEKPEEQKSGRRRGPRAGERASDDRTGRPLMVASLNEELDGELLTVPPAARR